MIEARVIRIISKKQLILNVGLEHGVEVRMKFSIYSPTVQIIDPETNEEMGEYRSLKTKVEVDSVFERFCIASRPYEYMDDTEPWEHDGDSVWPDLPVEGPDIDPLPTGSTIRIGDVAEEAPQPHPPDLAASADDEIPF